MTEPRPRVTSTRRYYLLERLAANRREDFSIASVFRAKQEAEPGTPLPTDFPYKTALATPGYTTIEDLRGADCDELTDAGLTHQQALSVLKALAAL